MRPLSFIRTVLLSACLLGAAQVGVAASTEEPLAQSTATNITKAMWQQEFKQLLPLLGHRNWVLVVDKAFPWQSAAGMTYIDSGEEIEPVLASVLEMFAEAPHVKPIVYTDKELNYLAQMGSEEKALVERFGELLKGHNAQSILHDEIFTKLDAASKLFNVVVIKTESLVAYSSVFI